MAASLDRTADWLDEDGYPTEEAEKRVREWDYKDLAGMFAFMKSLWQYADCGYWNECVGEDEGTWRYEISTAGWSGNESLVYALQKNQMAWMLSWVQSRRGGHYIFEIKN